MTDTPAVHLIAEVEPEHYEIAEGKRLRGNPRQSVWIEYTDASGQFVVGRWRSEPGQWRITYTEEEYCEILEGHSRIVSDTGEVREVHPGSRFVMPRGFQGSWEVLVTTTKRFVIYEPGAAR